MESKIKIYSIGIILLIFVSALIIVVEMPNIFENVLAQLEDSQQVSSISDKDRTEEEEDHVVVQIESLMMVTYEDRISEVD